MQAGRLLLASAAATKREPNPLATMSVAQGFTLPKESTNKILARARRGAVSFDFCPQTRFAYLVHVVKQEPSSRTSQYLSSGTYWITSLSCSRSFILSRTSSTGQCAHGVETPAACHARSRGTAPKPALSNRRAQGFTQFISSVYCLHGKVCLRSTLFWLPLLVAG